MSELDFVVGEKSLKVVANNDSGNVTVKVGENEFNFQSVGDNLFQVKTDGATHIVAAVKYKDVCYVDIDSTVIEVREAGLSQNNGGASAQSAIKDKVFAPMPGKIVKLLVKKGDKVTEKQPLAVVEAMKMENQINSPASGKVKAVNFAVGDQVNTTSPIIEISLD